MTDNKQISSEFEGRTIVITGAGAGIGKAWANGFLNHGGTVIAADIREDSLETLNSESGSGDRLFTVTTDVSRNDDVKQMIAFAIEKTGRVDVLFNNAGVGFGQTMESAPDGAFEHHVAIHLFGCVNAMRAAIPHMRRQGYGRIINTISRSAESSPAEHTAYSAAKAGMYATSRGVAREVADTNILINMVIPGMTNTGIWGKEMPQFQSPEATFPTARMLAGLPDGGPSGKVFWNEKEYPFFHPDNPVG